MPVRNPLRDQVAIVGVGITEYGRDLPRTSRSLGLEAARNAILDAGLSKGDIDGICANGVILPWRSELFLANVQMTAMQDGLGIPHLRWTLNNKMNSLVHAADAVFSGSCDVALVVQMVTRLPNMSSRARTHPYKGRVAELGRGYANLDAQPQGPEDYARRWGPGGGGAEPYAAWAGRYLHDYRVPRDVLGMIAINNRQNASLNPNAVMRTPITMEDYFAARMIRDPLGLLDCDLPVDCAEAIVVTTAERAADLPQKPVYVHAATIGQARAFYEAPENMPSWTQSSPFTAMSALWEKSDLGRDDVDIFYPYDGFTIMSLAWLEAAGFCGPGESWDYLRDSWNKEENRLLLDGRIPVQTAGGGLSAGRMTGFNYITESVLQLRGQAGDRQVPGARVSLIGAGSLFHDPWAGVLRVD